SRVFARHAYPRRFPAAQAVCPRCGGINETRFDNRACVCATCCETFDPQHGPARGKTATCRRCSHTFQIAKTIRERGHLPAHRLYAKLVLRPDGRKSYEPATDYDRALYAQAEAELATRQDAYPLVPVAPGYNTDQALGYNYRY